MVSAVTKMVVVVALPYMLAVVVLVKVGLIMLLLFELNDDVVGAAVLVESVVEVETWVDVLTDTSVEVWVVVADVSVSVGTMLVDDSVVTEMLVSVVVDVCAATAAA